MNKSYIFTPLLLLGGAILWISASQGVANIQQVDRTGSPVSTDNCTACHNAGANFSTVATVVVNDASGQAVSEYMPGETYGVTVKIQSSGNAAHGFQLTGLLSDNKSAGTCTANSTNTQKSNLNNRWYFEHAGPATGGVYEMTWVAPAIGSGDVTFYGSALSVDATGNTAGDEFANIPNLVLTESVASGVAELNNKSSLRLFPNPTIDQITVDLDGEIISKIDIYSISGSLVLSLETNSAKENVDVSELGEGSYFVKITSNENMYSSTFIKK